MKELKNKVAVITGAASGFGRELAILCAQEGMKLALADIQMQGLEETAGLVAQWKPEVLLQHCDVSMSAALDTLAQKTYERFGKAHLLFNNAGVAVSGPTWTATLEDWKWSIDVNLMGVVHGIRSFVPRMLEQGDECHVVNTASVAGLTSVPGSSVYCATKHGVVTVSECLYHDLAAVQSRIGVSVLCPAFVNTGIADSARNRPAELANTNPLGAEAEAMVRKALKSGKLSAADIARITMDGVKAERFYIITHPAIMPTIEWRMQDILQLRQPTSPLKQRERK
ncbi:MAG TPA: SDR family NAD(P)-dependent oxidoreductase [Solimonas sp.]|nr:SDR family NAD(P)-dependent oxidoreductase [Solimonas sp.]